MMADSARLRSSATFVLLAAIVCCGGCNRGPKCYPVSGKVTWQGEPVPLGEITFVPVAGGRPAIGKIQSDGNYQLTSYESGDGAEAGDYLVSIEALQVEQISLQTPKTFEEEKTMRVPLPTKSPKTRWLIPETFASPKNSGLKANVTSGQNSIDFALPK